MQDKDTTKSTFIQLFEPIFSKNFSQRLRDLEVDKYVKKLKTAQLIELVALAQLEQQRGLRDIGNSLNNDELSKAINLKSISASQISRRLRTLPSQVIQALFKAVRLEAGMKLGFNAVQRELGRINLIDSSTISLCLTRYPWADFRKTKSGVKLHLRLRFFENGVIPDDAVVTPARPSDKTQMDALVVEEQDALNVFDRGYVDYKKFDHYCEKGIRFVTRLKGNAVAEVVQELPVDSNSPIKRDCIVYLGTKGINRMQYPLRMLETGDTKGNPVTILTNDFERNADQIGDCRYSACLSAICPIFMAIRFAHQPCPARAGQG